VQENKITTYRDGVSLLTRVQRDMCAWFSVTNITGVPAERHVCESNGMPTQKHAYHPREVLNSGKAQGLKIISILGKLMEYKRSWIQHVNRLPRNRLPRVMKYYSPTGRRYHGRQKILCITRTVKHNCNASISTVRIQLYVSVLYVGHLQVEILT